MYEETALSVGFPILESLGLNIQYGLYAAVHSRYMRGFALTALFLPAMGLGQQFEYTIRLMGKDVGTGTVTYQKDGSFDSKSSAVMGPQSVTSHLILKMAGSKIESFRLEESGGTQRGVISWAKDKLNVETQGKSVVKDKAQPLKVPVFSTFNPAVVTLIYKDYLAKKSPAKVSPIDINQLRPIDMDASEVQTTVETTKGVLPVTKFNLRMQGIDIVYILDSEQHVLGMNVPAQQFQFVAKGYEGVFVDPLSKYPELSQPTYKVKTETRVPMKTRDGVRLLADIVRPDDNEKHPTILVRTPYGRSSMTMAYEFFARRGYVLVCQDVRGRGGSDGEWDPLNHEVADGDDTLNWIAAQPWSDGGVGMIGGSYLGFVQWAAAVTGNPVLKCIIPQVSPPDPTLNLPWDNGVFMLTPGLWWSRIVMERQANMAAAGQGISDFKPFATLPVSKVDNAMFKKDIPFFDLWLQRPKITDWKGSFRMDQIKDVKIPVMHVSGIWDGDGIGTRLHYEALRDKGNQWLVFGPWEHGFNLKTKFGDQDYGPDSVLELDSVYLRFFDAHLKGKEVSLDKQPRVRFFVTGSNRWNENASWPPVGSKANALYLSGGTANGAGSKGALKSKPGNGKDTLDYDPMKIQPPKKGFEVESSTATTTFKLKELRKADLLYVSDPFKGTTSLTGVDADLYVSTTAKDASFFVSVGEVSADGKFRVLCQNGNGTMAVLANHGAVVTPGKIYKVTLKPWYFAHQFKAGTRLGIRVTNDLFPQYAKIPGTGESLFTATKYVRSKNSVYKSAKYPSRVRFWTFDF